ncbi:MAG: GNAT family N-acetyltransferase [Syntrophales bacterium]
MRHLSGDEDINITFFQGMAGLESLRNVWNEIVSGMNRRHYFHLWEWHYSHLKCLEADPRSLVFFLFTKGTLPVAIFPLQFTKVSLGGLKLKALAFPSHDHMQLCDLVCHRDALDLPLFRILSQHLSKQGKLWDMIQLPHLLEGACALQIVNNQPPPRFLLKHEGRCDSMDTTGTYESFLSCLSKNFRRSLKRAKQYLDELHGIQFTFTRNGPELEEKLEAFMDVEASGWKGALGIGTAIKLHPSLRCFYSTLVRTLSASGRVSINTLTTDGKCIAAQFCILLDDTAYVLKIGYDEGYKRYAPGNFLVDLLLKQSMEEGAIKNINLITDAEWHADWRPKTYNKSKLYVFNATPAGRVGFIIMKYYPTLKEYYQTHIKHHLSRRIQK